MHQQYGEPQMEVIFVLLEFRMAETLDILTWFSETNSNKKQELYSSRIYLARLLDYSISQNQFCIIFLVFINKSFHKFKAASFFWYLHITHFTKSLV
jgi:hypothetical protein